jgi:DNA repair exonuclease SbcCD ATPase subunit
MYLVMPTVPFTTETARANVPKSVESRLRRKREQQELIASLLAKISQSAAPNDDFTERRVNRIRKQLETLDGRLDELSSAPDIDAAAIDRVASAISRLSELERQLSGRPLPGSLRPTAARAPRPHQGPID